MKNKKNFKKVIITFLLALSITISNFSLGSVAAFDKEIVPNVEINVLEQFTIVKTNYYRDNLLTYIHHVGYKNGQRYSGYLKMTSVVKVDGIYRATYSGLLELDSNY